MTSWFGSRWMGAAVGAVAVACTASAPSRPAPRMPERSAAGDANIRRLILDTATSGETCAKISERFIGLPANGGPSGAAAGTTPIVGRWWIRDCRVTSNGRTLKLRLSGPAWYRVDQSQSGYSLHQYVYFDVDTTMTGALDVGYDPAARVASIWFTPTRDARVSVDPVGPLNLHADGLLSWLFKPFAASAVRAKVVSEGETTLRNRLSGGVTLTVDLRRHDQVDLLLGQLPRGQAPVRPFGDGIAWLANQRLEFFPGGLQVQGPFPSGKTSTDAAVERGPEVQYALVCARDLQTAFNTLSRGKQPVLPRAAIFQRGHWLPGPVETVRVNAPCPWYLVSASESQQALARVRVRNGQPTARRSSSKFVTVTLVSFRINAKKPNGNAWDAFGGAPDPAITIRDARVSYPVFSANDTFQATPDVAAPEPFEMTPGNRIVLSAVDKDVVFDDPIGTAVIRYQDLRRGPDLTLPLQLNRATTGSVRVRIHVH